MKIAIGIATYRRLDGTTPQCLQRAIESILSQTHQDYKLFLIGDHYDDEKEFESLAKDVPKEKLFKKNLPFAKERDKYQIGTRELWCSGGVNAYNTAIDACLSEDIDYMCHLDHDDYWSNDHLASIVDVIKEKKENVACVYTCASYLNSSHLPRVALNSAVTESFPTPVNVIHSSICINHKLVSLKYRDVFEETNSILEADIDMWQRLRSYCIEKNLKSYLIPKVTCYHPKEKY